MAEQVPRILPIDLLDVRNYDSWPTLQPSDLLTAIAVANGTTGSIPFNTRWDGRYVGAKNSLLNFQAYGAGGFNQLNFLFGSHLTSFNITTWVAAFGGIVGRTFDKVSQGSGTTWFTEPPDASGTGSVVRTVTMQTNLTGSARSGGIRMNVLVGGTKRWESQTVFFNQPSL